jgi:hypothetical protein
VGGYTHRIEIDFGNRKCIIEACTECYEEYIKSVNEEVFVDGRKKTIDSLKTCKTSTTFF